MRNLLVALGMVSALLLAGCAETQGPSAQPSERESSPTRTRPAAPPSERNSASALTLHGDWQELGPEGFLELRLGMSRTEALKTGRITLGTTTGRCTGFYLAMYGDGSGLGAHGFLTKGRGLSVIHGQDGMHTPQGIRLGSPMAALEDVYAHLVGSDRFTTAPATDRSAYYFIGGDDSVAYFGLSFAGDLCLTRWLSEFGARR